MSLLTNETINHILDRRSIRSYKPEAIPADVVETLLTAAVHAPPPATASPGSLSSSTTGPSWIKSWAFPPIPK